MSDANYPLLDCWQIEKNRIKLKKKNISTLIHPLHSPKCKFMLMFVFPFLSPFLPLLDRLTFISFFRLDSFKLINRRRFLKNFYPAWKQNRRYFLNILIIQRKFLQLIPRAHPETKFFDLRFIALQQKLSIKLKQLRKILI